MRRIAILVLAGALMLALVAGAATAVPGKGQGQTKASKGQSKVSICHKGKTITVAAPALKGHLKHGDTRGACPPPPPPPDEGATP